MRKSALYPGSFDPFTNGHLDIVKKATALFEEVYIIIGVNSSKRRDFNPEDVKIAIEETLSKLNITNFKVCIYDGLIAEFAKSKNIKYMIRGLRNNMDYNYEENIAEVNKLVYPEMEYIYFRAENVAVSSSMVKELNRYNQDVSKYVPESVMKIMSR